MDEITQVGRKVCENFVLMSTHTYTHTVGGYMYCAAIYILLVLASRRLTYC